MAISGMDYGSSGGSPGAAYYKRKAKQQAPASPPGGFSGGFGAGLTQAAAPPPAPAAPSFADSFDWSGAARGAEQERLANQYNAAFPSPSSPSGVPWGGFQVGPIGVAPTPPAPQPTAPQYGAGAAFGGLGAGQPQAQFPGAASGASAFQTPGFSMPQTGGLPPVGSQMRYSPAEEIGSFGDQPEMGTWGGLAPFWSKVQKPTVTGRTADQQRLHEKMTAGAGEARGSRRGTGGDVYESMKYDFAQSPVPAGDWRFPKVPTGTTLGGKTSKFETAKARKIMDGKTAASAVSKELFDRNTPGSLWPWLEKILPNKQQARFLPVVQKKVDEIDFFLRRGAPGDAQKANILAGQIKGIVQDLLFAKVKDPPPGGGGGGGAFNAANAAAVQRNWQIAMNLLKDAQGALAGDPAYQRAMELMMAMMSGERLPYDDETQAAIYGGIAAQLDASMQTRLREGEAALASAGLRTGPVASFREQTVGQTAKSLAAAAAQEKARMAQANFVAQQQASGQATAAAGQRVQMENAIRQQMAQMHANRQLPAYTMA